MDCEDNSDNYSIWLRFMNETSDWVAAKYLFWSLQSAKKLKFLCETKYFGY